MTMMTTRKMKNNVNTEESTIERRPKNKNDDPDTDHIHKEYNSNTNNSNSNSNTKIRSSPSNGKQILNFLSSDADDSMTDLKDSKLLVSDDNKGDENNNDNNNDNSSRASSGKSKSKSSLLSKASSTWRSVKRYDFYYDNILYRIPAIYILS